MDTDRYPTGSRVDVWWPGDKEWYTASVLKTRTVPHTIDGTKALCREIFCYYDLDGHMQWHALSRCTGRVAFYCFLWSVSVSPL